MFVLGSGVRESWTKASYANGHKINFPNTIVILPAYSLVSKAEFVAMAAIFFQRKVGRYLHT